MYNIPPKTLFIGKHIIYLPSCHSTNDFAHEYIKKNNSFEGTVIITDEQLAGKGQAGNSWESAPNKNITLSLIIHPKFLDVKEQFFLNIIISLAVLDFLTNNCNKRIKIKWPNDIYYNNTKLAGILIQNFLKGSQIQQSIIGLGVNINQEKFIHPKATSLKNITGNNFYLEELVNNLLEFIEKRYLFLKENYNNRDYLKNEYLENLYRIKELHNFKSNNHPFEGQIIGIDEWGRLKIEVNGDQRVFNVKEVEFIN